MIFAYKKFMVQGETYASFYPIIMSGSHGILVFSKHYLGLMVTSMSIKHVRYIFFTQI